MGEYWVLNTRTKKYETSSSEPFSVFPTIVNAADKTVFCRRCHRWEYIIRFKDDVLITQCGQPYKGMIVQNGAQLNYGFEMSKNRESYIINVKSQRAEVGKQRLFDNQFILDLDRKQLIKDGKPVFKSEDIRDALCDELTEQILDEMGERYKKQFGLKPTVASKLHGFSVLVGYMLSPFNVNFYKIAQHWGLNPYDRDFASLSSGDTPTAENEMFESLGIKATKTVRKMYQQTPQSVICYAAAKDMGFTDVNILQKSYSSKFYAFLAANMISFAGGTISYGAKYGIDLFVHDLLEITNQKTVWNAIKRTVDYFTENPSDEMFVADGLNTYAACREHLSEQEKKEIMRECFNKYTHDFLVRRADELQADVEYHTYAASNVTFDIEPQFLELEYKCGPNRKKQINAETGEEEYVEVPDEERFCFYVARDSAMLKVIGSAMHNCVGWGYTNSVQQRHCTIVYAKYRGKIRICIEVTPTFTIRQSLGACNQPLNNEEMDAYREWCKEKRIQFVKAFNIHCAV